MDLVAKARNGIRQMDGKRHHFNGIGIGTNFKAGNLLQIGTSSWLVISSSELLVCG